MEQARREVETDPQPGEWGTPESGWLLDWDRDSGRWNIWTMERTLIGRFVSVSIRSEAALVSTDGGRHGYLTTIGVVRETPDGEAVISEE